ncbi:MAG: MFS transporter [Gammaproteobacteria bacterium]|nr:MFS transporter [Gammaproteobacteria bacterium]
MINAKNYSKPTGNRRELISWCLYDWANSAFPTVIITFVFAAYFTNSVAEDQTRGTSLWGGALSLSALAVAVFAPFLGAIADHSGNHKRWLWVFTLLSAFGAMMLWTVEPKGDHIMHGLFWVALANFGFELSMVFYNAMLPFLAPGNQLGRWSGWGWGVGYLGGLACLGIVLVMFIQTEIPMFNLNKDASEELRITGPFVATWMLIFALPLFLLVPDTGDNEKRITSAVREGLKSLGLTIKKLREYKGIVWFLFARMCYTDGLNTLFAFGGIYAAGTFGFNFQDLIIFGITINLTAGIGAIIFAWIDDWLGPKTVITIGLTGLVVFGSALLVVESQTLFWIFGIPLGVFVGPIQSASRSLMAHIAPASMRMEFFGLYALSGKATAFLAPALLAMATSAFDSQRAGMTTVILFLILGMILLIKVPPLNYCIPPSPAP